MENQSLPVKVAAVADLHFSRVPQQHLQAVFAEATKSADILLLCGDLTDTGLPDEAKNLARELNAIVKIPCIGVLGNHDFESGKQDEVKTILRESGINILDGDACEIKGVGFAGAKGFAGGFGPGALQPWGEDVIKLFVREAVNESLKLETALAKLRVERKIAILHYSPSRATVEGEPPEILPWLGSNRLEDPFTRYEVNAVFHGHAHRGQLHGTTRNNIPVYNVSMSVLQRTFPDRPPFYLLEI
ncbi:MAG: metallophosphoesterase [Ignavibacteriae bacterium]|nr:metallophosphoesterase [Ignavibacteriota bacterium]